MSNFIKLNPDQTNIVRENKNQQSINSDRKPEILKESWKFKKKQLR